MTKNCSTSNADKERIISNYENQISIIKTAEILGIQRTTAHEINEKFQKTGIIHEETRGSKATFKLDYDQKNAMRSRVDEDCTLSHEKIVDRVLREFLITFLAINFCIKIRFSNLIF